MISAAVALFNLALASHTWKIMSGLDIPAS